MKGDNIVVHNMIIHYLNKESEKLILTDYENTSNIDLDKDFKKIFKSVAKNEFTRKGVFENYKENKIKEYAESIIYNTDSFVENSKNIAKELYETMKISENIDSGCLLIGLFSVNDEKQVGIFKVNFKKSYAKEIKHTDGNKFKMTIVKQDDLLPENMATTQSAIIMASGVNDEYHALVLDKKPEKEKLDSDFIQKFLKISKIEDDSYKTKVLKETMDTFIINSFGDNIKEGEDTRYLFTQILKNEDSITPREIVNKLIDDEYRKEVLIEVLENKITDLDEEMEVNREWIDKKLKSRTIKTDTGIQLKGLLEDFEDPMKYSLVKNNDGTCNIVIKNIKILE